MQVWCLGEQVGRPGTWVQEEVLEPVFTGSSLGLQSVVMGMEPGSAWVDLDPGSRDQPGTEYQWDRSSIWVHGG